MHEQKIAGDVSQISPPTKPSKTGHIGGDFAPKQDTNQIISVNGHNQIANEDNPASTASALENRVNSKLSLVKLARKKKWGRENSQKAITFPPVRKSKI